MHSQQNITKNALYVHRPVIGRCVQTVPQVCDDFSYFFFNVVLHIIFNCECLLFMIRHHFDLNTMHRCMFLRCMLMCFRCVCNTEQVCAIGNVSNLCSVGVQLESGSDSGYPCLGFSSCS